jgi:hypothetical protein
VLIRFKIVQAAVGVTAIALLVHAPLDPLAPVAWCVVAVLAVRFGLAIRALRRRGAAPARSSHSVSARPTPERAAPRRAPSPVANGVGNGVATIAPRVSLPELFGEEHTSQLLRSIGRSE